MNHFQPSVDSDRSAIYMVDFRPVYERDAHHVAAESGGFAWAASDRDHLQVMQQSDSLQVPYTRRGCLIVEPEEDMLILLIPVN
jgi:hypothetical protein